MKLLLVHLMFMSALLLPSCNKNAPTTKSDDSSGKLLWTDDFDQLSERWRIADWTFANNLCEFSPKTVRATSGMLYLGIQKKIESGSYPEKPYLGAEVYTTEEYLYGKFVVRMQPNSPPGVVTSFFLMNGVYDDGELVDWFEIDIEFAGRTNSVSYALHWMTNGELHSTSQVVPLDFDAADAMHGYAIEWRADSIRFFVDDRLSATFEEATILQELQHPMSIHMNYWVSNSQGWVGEFDESRLPIKSSYDEVAYNQF
jgi:beta-glucanase (GH16 family)